VRVIYVYSQWCAPAVEAIRRHAPGAVFFETSGLYDYNVVMAQEWDSGEDLVVVEGDKVLHYGVMPSFADCGKPWCLFGYHSYPPPYVRPITIGLGCTRFSAALQHEFGPEEFLVDDDPGWGFCTPCNGHGCWRYLDSRIDKCLWARGHSPHLHGWVEHLHEYPEDWGETIGQYLDGFGPVTVAGEFRRRDPPDHRQGSAVPDRVR